MISKVEKVDNKIKIIYTNFELHLSDLILTPLGEIFSRRLGRLEFLNFSSVDNIDAGVFDIVDREVSAYKAQHPDEYLKVLKNTVQSILENFLSGGNSTPSPLLGFYHEINLDTETQGYKYSFVEKTWSNGRQNFRQGDNDGSRAPSSEELVILLNLINSD